jgi:quercetin dioxygenase-like cupin family protein
VIERAETVLVCHDLHEALDELTRLGFQIDTIWPADDPAVALLRGHGLRLRVARGAEPSGTLRLVAGSENAPGIRSASGIRIEIVASDPDPPVLPDLVPSFVITRDDPGAWKLGRAGMEYRDLIPDRQGGRFIASHIRIRRGGPVADWVHFHAIRFQMIYCHQGWVRLAYEDQGEPFVMKAGQCVLQPPEIRHRVLESSPGLEVVEIGCPAVHPTHADHDLALPTAELRPDRDFGGQRFVWDRSLDAPASASAIAKATGGLASARIVRGTTEPATHDGELLFGFVVEGALAIVCDGTAERLAPADAFVIPPGAAGMVESENAESAWLEVRVARRSLRAPAIG